jgi:hypothetical protein
LRRIFRIARRLHRRREYFKVIRVAELIGYYLRYLRLFEAGGVTLAVTSNHSNPHGLGFTLAARKCGIPVALITHGMPVQPVARLEYALAVVHCEAARRIYLDGGCRMDRILIHGRSRRYVSMSTVRLPGALTVGIFLCKDVNQDQLDNLCKRLLRHPQVSRIVIRPHPTNLWKGFDQWTGSQPHRVLRSRTQSVFDDIQTAHIVLGGNSSVLVDAVIAGKPSGYVPGLDCGAPDFHGFVASGLIYPIDKEPGFDPAMMMQFYLRPEWRATLRRFANIDEEESAVAAKAGAAMRDLARRQDKGSLQNESTSEVGSSWLKI